MQMRKVLCSVVAGCVGALVSAQDASPAKESNQDVQARLSKLEQDMKEIRAKQEQQVTTSGEDIDSIEKRLAELQINGANAKPGTRRFLLTGFAFGSFENAKGSNSSFNAGFNPIFLWSPADRVLVEGQAEMELENSDTVTKLEYIQLSYLMNDYMTFGVGKFLNPANFWKERLHPAWINKLPDEPIAFEDNAILGESQVGAQLHGVIPIVSTKMEYALFVSNGGSLITDDPNAYGTIEFDNYTDTNNSKNVGGRLGFFILPELEVGYSLEYAANVTPSGNAVSDAKAVIQCVDLNFTHSTSLGHFDFRGQWAFTGVDNVTYDPTGTLGFGPVALDNSRNGGYLQAAYRPTNAKSSFLSKLEGVVRYDAITLPAGAPEGVDESRMTFGVDYWGTANSVFKVAYEVDDKHGGQNSDAVLVQWAIGL